MQRSFLAALAFLLATTACDRGSQPADADLTRDLQLASQQAAAPRYADAPLADLPEQQPPTASAPERRRSAPSPAPVRTRRPETVVTSRTATSTNEAVEPESDPAPAPGAASAPFRGIGAGTSFGLVTRGQVCTSNLPGDKVVATTTEDVRGDKGALIPAGTSVVLEVVSVTPGDSPETASIALRVRSVLVGDPLPVEASVTVVSELARGSETKNGGSDKKKVIGGAIAGAVLGQIMGRDTKSTVIGAAAGAAAGTAAAAATRKYHACLPAGGALRVTTSQPIIMN